MEINNSINSSIANLFWNESNNTKNSKLVREKMSDLFFAVMSNKDLAIVEINSNGQFNNIFKILNSNEQIMDCVDANGKKMEFYVHNKLVPTLDSNKQIVGYRLGVMTKANAESMLKGKPKKSNYLYDIAVIKNKVN